MRASARFHEGKSRLFRRRLRLATLDLGLILVLLRLRQVVGCLLAQP